MKTLFRFLLCFCALSIASAAYAGSSVDVVSQTKAKHESLYKCVQVNKFAVDTFKNLPASAGVTNVNVTFYDESPSRVFWVVHYTECTASAPMGPVRRQRLWDRIGVVS